MTQLLAPTFGSAGSGTAVLFDGGIASPGAHFVHVTVQGEYELSGNGAYVVRLYEGAAPLALTTLLGAQQGPFAVGVREDTTTFWPLTTYTAGMFLTAWVSSSTVGSLAMYVSMYDDVNLYNVTPGGCCHDPMLDTLLGLLDRTFPPP